MRNNLILNFDNFYFCSSFDHWLENIYYADHLIKVNYYGPLDKYSIVFFALVKDTSDNNILPMCAESHLFTSDISEDEFIEVVFNLILECEIHDIKERFIYKGKQIYSPHNILR